MVNKDYLIKEIELFISNLLVRINECVAILEIFEESSSFLFRQHLKEYDAKIPSLFY